MAFLDQIKNFKSNFYFQAKFLASNWAQILSSKFLVRIIAKIFSFILLKIIFFWNYHVNFLALNSSCKFDEHRIKHKKNLIIKGIVNYVKKYLLYLTKLTKEYNVLLHLPLYTFFSFLNKHLFITLNNASHIKMENWALIELPTHS